MSDRAARQQRLALALLWLVPAFWAVNCVVARKANGVIGPHLLALGRWAIAEAVLLLVSGAEVWGERRHVAMVWPQYLVLGTLGRLICGAWVYQGALKRGHEYRVDLWRLAGADRRGRGAVVG